jgi:hypothetical protein
MDTKEEEPTAPQESEFLPCHYVPDPIDTTQESQPDGELTDDEEEDSEEAEPIHPEEVSFREFQDDITFDALLYSHVVLKCGIHEVHAPVVSTLMLMTVIGMSPATFFVGFGVGLPVFWLAQRCLAR